jgi:flavin reductase (DIM6/NTAB) family NADH-FMN oxidoreductase RutF
MSGRDQRATHRQRQCQLRGTRHHHDSARTIQCGVKHQPTTVEAMGVRASSEAAHLVVEPSILYFGTPVALIGSLNEDDTPNLAPMSSAWALGYSVVLGLGDGGQTIRNLQRRPECTINLPAASLWRSVERLAPLTGRNPVPECTTSGQETHSERPSVLRSERSRAAGIGVNHAAPIVQQASGVHRSNDGRQVRLVNLGRGWRQDVVPDHREAACCLTQAGLASHEPPVQVRGPLAVAKDVDAFDGIDRENRAFDAGQHDTHLSQHLVWQVAWAVDVDAWLQDQDHRQATARHGL